MIALVACRASRRRSTSYNARLKARLRPPATAMALALALAAGGCAMSGNLGSMLGDKSKANPDAELVTGSINRPVRAAAPISNLPPEADLAYARAAVADLLGAGRDTASAPWENPKTGARGTVTPIASSYVLAGATCRDFLASYVRDRVEAWMQGEACRANEGRWEVKSLRPWKRS